MSSVRTQYSEEVKATVKAKYHLCRTPEDRDALARECGIDSRQKLYNLASRLNATRPHANSSSEWIDGEGGYDAIEDESRLRDRDDPDLLVWSSDDDRYLTEHFGRTHIEHIAFYLSRTETAVAYRARRLGLRNVPKYYDIKKVAPWLGLPLRTILLLSKRGLEIHPCTDRNGRLQITLVSTTSLARVLLKHRLWKALVDRHGADVFFIRDVVESVVALQKGDANWEPSCWVSHGHTCLNPFSDVCFGLFFNGHDDEAGGRVAGYELDPRDLAPSAKVESDSWRRGSHAKARWRGEDDLTIPEGSEALLAA